MQLVHSSGRCWRLLTARCRTAATRCWHAFSQVDEVRCLCCRVCRVKTICTIGPWTPCKRSLVQVAATWQPPPGLGSMYPTSQPFLEEGLDSQQVSMLAATPARSLCDGADGSSLLLRLGAAGCQLVMYDVVPHLRHIADPVCMPCMDKPCIDVFATCAPPTAGRLRSTIICRP